MCNGIFGGLFDFDGNGKMDFFESAAELMFIDEILNDEEDDEIMSQGLDPDDYDEF